MEKEEQILNIEVDYSTFGSILRRITVGLQAARSNIKTWSNDVAEKDLEASGLKDVLDEIESDALIDAATATNDETGKLKNPNLDAQKAAMRQALNSNGDYTKNRLEYREVLRDIQRKKNAITCEHERRGDLKTEVELLKALRSG
jgi:hypothetical protein